ncbi:hypothetical protein [Bernardetia sp.]|uniref:hypothetical protein n=1 Tax=Bernardetia sp. TaxID=1937974 RepID=UPI0025C40EFA|nr:hypothetical protein [Bernardetia sp.]
MKNKYTNRKPKCYYEFRELVRKRLLHGRITEVFYVLDKREHHLRYNPVSKSYDSIYSYNSISYKDDWKINAEVEKHEVNHKVLFRLYGRGIVGILGTRRYLSYNMTEIEKEVLDWAGLDILKKSEQIILPNSKSINVSETTQWEGVLHQKIIQIDIYWVGIIDSDDTESGYPMTLQLLFENGRKIWISLIREGINEFVDDWGTEFMTIYFSENVQKEIIKNFDSDTYTAEYYSSLAETAIHIDIR